MANVRDLMTPADAIDLEERFDAVLRERKEYEDRVGEGFAEVQRREVFDWEVDLRDIFE